MAIDLFGFSIGKKSKSEQIETNLKQESFVASDEYDGAQSLQTGETDHYYSSTMPP